ncbi:MAG: AarF/ABC1/UbiB kinase family protein [Bdellovibrionales bacterium]|nr:AarF/ABC1/UbiB kinase family protein [Bdellovibrionales bacterium]
MELQDVLQIDRTFRNAKRYREILTVLIKHGFADILTETNLGRWARRELKLDTRIPLHLDVEHLSREVRIRKVVEELGPTFIKMGQILSTRPDLIPPSFAEEFKKLQADCPRIPFSEIRAVIDQEFPGRVDEMFRQIDPTPIAAASLAQAHRAKLRDGSEVVLKVLRPGVRDLVDADIGVMSSLADFLENTTSTYGFSLRGVAKEFAKELQREINLELEAVNTIRLRGYFLEHPGVSFPRVYPQFSSRSVLTLEYIPGKMLSDVDLATLSPEKRRRLVEFACDAVFQQCFELGFFHADPHPGNIIIRPDDTLCFIDCGMTGRIERRTSQQLAELISGVVSGDLDRVLEVVISLGDADPALIHSRSFRNEAWDFIARFQDSTLATLDIGNLLNDFFTLLRKNGIQCPSDIVFLIKAVTTIEGAAESLDPTFDVVGYMKPYVENLVVRQYGPKAIARRVRKAFVNYAEFLEDFPLHVRGVIERIGSSRFHVNLEHRGLDRLIEVVRYFSTTISTTLLTAAVFVGSAILILADRIGGRAESALSTVAYIGLTASIAMILILCINNFWFNRRK